MTIKNVLITGCNRGIGFELCKQLCQLSTTETVIATTRRPQNATELNRLLGFHYPKLHLLRLETTDYRYYDKLLDDCHKIVGNKGLNLLINNAGIISRDSLPIVTAQHVMDNLETNAVAPLMLTNKLLPLLITSAKNMEPTSVVNMSSTLGSMKSNIIKGQQYYPYRISKAGLNMMTKLLAFDLSEHKIQVIALHPGWVKTDMGTQNALLETQFSVKSCLKVILNITNEMNGKLVNYDGKVLEF